MLPRSPRRRLSAAVVAALATTSLAGALAPTAAAAPGDPAVTEVHYDNAGTDAGEAVEVSAAPGTDLTGWTVVLYNGSGGGTYGTPAPLGGVVDGSGTAVVRYPTDGVQNGSPDGVALVRPDGSVAQFLSYEGTMTATNGPAQGMTSTDIGVAETTSTPVGQSLQLVDGAWTGPRASTFGAANGAATPPPPPVPTTCDTEDTPISAVQGTGSASPLAGRTVTVEGVVTADQQDGGFSGFTLQSTGPRTPGASDAVFVFRGPQVALGDRVQVTGEVSEFQGLTEITTTGLVVCAPGAALPPAAPLAWPVPEAEREALESMRVAPAGQYTVTEVFNLNRFGEVVLAPGAEPFRTPTDVARPGSEEARALAARQVQGELVLDDARSTDFSRTGGAPSYGSATDAVRVGDRVASFGDVVLDFRFGAWRLQPATPVVPGAPGTPVVDDANPRTAAPEAVGGDLQVASFNVLNYFTTLTSVDGDARGADTAEELARQQAKIVAAINSLGAEVVSLEEIENSAKFGPDRDAALATLVAALNADAGAGTWAFVPSPTVRPAVEDEDVIRTAFIYRPAAVTPQGESVIDDDPAWTGVARQPLAQTFRARSGKPFTVVVNHFKSKGSSAGGAGDADTGDGQGASNGTRVRQAQRLDTFVDQLLATGDRPADVLLVGDFNSYTQEDPLQVLYGEGYANLGAELDAGESSYVFDGASGSLDHALASPAMRARVTGVDHWNINAVESYGYQYDGYAGWYAPDAYRSSDHDPVVVGITTHPRGGAPGKG